MMPSPPAKLWVSFGFAYEAYEMAAEQRERERERDRERERERERKGRLL
jgi:hypothetical protein